MKKVNRPIGIGSVSLFLVVWTIIWSFNIGKFCLGDRVLNTINLPVYSDGTQGIHYTIFYSYLFLVPALLLAIKYKNNLFAKTGRNLSIFLIVILSISGFFIVI